VFVSFGRISSVISLRDSAAVRAGCLTAKSMRMSSYWSALPSSVGHPRQTRNAPDFTASKQCITVNRGGVAPVDKIAMLKEILAQNPNDAFARYGLAMEHAAQGDATTALAEFQQLTDIHPDYTAGYQMSAQLLLKAGRTEEARQRLEAGVAAARRIGNQLALNEMSAMLDEFSV